MLSTEGEKLMNYLEKKAYQKRKYPVKFSFFIIVGTIKINVLKISTFSYGVK